MISSNTPKSFAKTLFWKGFLILFLSRFIRQARVRLRSYKLLSSLRWEVESQREILPPLRRAYDVKQWPTALQLRWQMTDYYMITSHIDLAILNPNSAPFLSQSDNPLRSVLRSHTHAYPMPSLRSRGPRWRQVLYPLWPTFGYPYDIGATHLYQPLP